jgi:hypothetical protein
MALSSGARAPRNRRSAAPGAGHDPLVLGGEIGAKARTAALARLQPDPGQSPTARGRDRFLHRGRLRLPRLDSLFLATRSPLDGASSSTPDEFCCPSRQRHCRDARLPRHRHQRALRIPRQTRPRYTSLGFPDSRRIPTRPVRVLLGKIADPPPDNQCVITRNPVSRLGTQPLLNHARQHRWQAHPTAPLRLQHPDQYEQGPQPTRPA